mgnify:CR=1 FL=1
MHGGAHRGIGHGEIVLDRARVYTSGASLRNGRTAAEGRTFVDRNADSKVDVRMQLEEQNRNQLSFGAGVSQFEGFFGQL